MTRLTRARTAGLLAVLGLVAAACGNLDTSELESLAAQRIETAVGFVPASVSCPEDIEPSTGATFTCAVTGTDGTKAEIEFSQLDDKGNVEALNRLLPTASVEAAIVEELGATEVDCPEIVAVEAGKTIECSASAGTDAATIVVTIENDDGDVTFERR